MNIKRILAGLNPFANRRSSAYQMLMIGDSNYQNPEYKYELYATEGYQIQSVVFACIGLIIQGMQSVDWAYEQDGEKIEEDKLDKNLQVLTDLLSDPDPYTTRNEWIAEYILHLYIGGSAFMRVEGVKVVNPDSTVRAGLAPELLLERPDKVTINMQGRQVLGFTVQYDTGKKTYTTEEMTFIRLMNPLSHIAGQPPMQAAALEIDALNSGRKLNAKTLDDGGVLKSIIALKGQRNVQPDKMDEIRLKFWERYEDAKKEGKPMVFDGDGADYHTLSQTMSELDWTSNEGLMARRICNVFNVPSQLLGDPDTSKYSNYQEAMKDFYITNVLPTTNTLLGKHNRWLVPMYDDSGVKIVPDPSGVQVLQEDEAKLVDWLVKADWMSKNEKRARMDMEPTGNPDDDIVTKEMPNFEPGNNKDDDDSDDKRSTRNDNLDHVDDRSMFRTEESRVAEFKRKDNIRKRNEDKYEAELNKYFDGQRKRLIDAFVNATGGKKSKRADDDPLLIPLENTFVVNLFNRIDENAKYVEDLNELTRGILVDFGQDAIDQFVDEGVLFNVDRPAMQKFIADDMFARSELINGTQADTMQGIITEGYNKGLSQDGIANLITDKYEEISAGRAKTIARTEVGRSAGIATQEGFEQAGVQYREWLSARDGNVREDHVYMDGVVEALSDPFVGPGGQMTSTIPPTSGDPAFDINCRCVAVPLETRGDAI